MSCVAYLFGAGALGCLTAGRAGVYCARWVAYCCPVAVLVIQHICSQTCGSARLGSARLSTVKLQCACSKEFEVNKTASALY